MDSGRAIRAGVAYFAVVFAAGFLFGAVRQLVLWPRMNEAVAVAIEAPFMLVAILLASRWLVRRLRVARGGERWLMGLMALAVLIPVEIGLGWAMRGLSPGAWLAHLGTPAGLIEMALWAAFAAVPSLIGRFSGLSQVSGKIEN